MKKLIALALGPALGLCASTPAWAADWTYITESTDGDVYHVDSGSIRNLRSWKVAWQKVTRTSPEPNGSVETKSMAYFNCQDGTRALKSTVDYKPNGVPVISATWPDYQLEWDPPVPDTVGYSVFNFVCSRP